MFESAFDLKKESRISTIDKTKVSLTPEETKNLIIATLDQDKAHNICSIPLKEGSALADYMIIASGTSSRHVSALARKLKEKLNHEGIKQVTMEGLSQSDWVVIDAGDAIIHIFRPEVREFYNIEKMWDTGNMINVVPDQIQA